MQVYIFIFCYVVIFGCITQMTSKRVCINEYTYENRANLFMALATFSVIIFFAGFRTSVADTGVYINAFKNAPFIQNAQEYLTDPGARDPGFRLLTVLIKTYISTDFTVWLFIIAIITGLGIMYPLYKYSCNYGISMFLFIASCQFTWMFNGMRQFLAAAIIFACTGLILKNKTLLYTIIILLLSTIHQSTVVLIPIYFIVKGEPWSKKTLLFICIVIMIILFSGEFTDLLYDAVENTNYQSSMYEFRESDDGTNIIRILVESVPIILAFIYRRKIKDRLTPVIKLSINMSLVASGFYIISKVAKSGIMLGRLPIYFSLYNLILLPWLLKNIFDDKNEKRLVIYIMIVCYILYFYYQMYVAWSGLRYGSSVLNIWY